MNRALGLIFVLAYIVLCFATLAYWLPNFFAANFLHTPEPSYRYLTATGLPFGLLLVTVIARQSPKVHFSIVMFFQVFTSGGFPYAGLYAFYYPQQATFFCAAHLFICATGVAWNLYQHRKELARFERAAVAAAA